jgi:hypothetical protein
MSRAFNICFSILLTAVVCSIFIPQAELWSLNFLLYFPVPLRVLLLVCAIIVIAAGFAPSRWWCREPILRVSQVRHPLLRDVIIAALCGLIFFSFASKTALLGDGQVWITGIQLQAADYLRCRAPLTIFLLRVLYAWLNPAVGMSAEHLIVLTSIIAGTVAVFGWLRLAQFLGIGPFTCLLFGFSWGGIEFYFGYVETYTIMAAMITWMLTLMIISLRTDVRSWFVPVLGVLAVGFNFSAVVFLPALAAYSWRMFSRKPLRARSVLLGSLMAFAFALMIYLARGWYKGTDIFLPLVRTDRASAFGDSVLSVKHLWDIANGLLLGGGALLVWLAIHAATTFKVGIRWKDEKLILLLMLMFPLAACIMHNPQLGMARDWDICAVMLVAMPVIALVMWKKRFLESPIRVQTIMAAWLLVVIVPWIGVQASEARSLQRFKDLLRLDPARSVTGWDYLASYYFRRNSLDDFGQCTLEALRVSNNTRYHCNAVIYYVMKRDWSRARLHADFAHAAVSADSVISDWEREVTDPGTLLALGSQYMDSANYKDAKQTLDVATHLQPESLWPDILSADLAIRQRDLSAARKTLETLFVRDAAALKDGQKYFAEKSKEGASDQQCTGWIGLSLIAGVRNDSSEARNSAEKARAHCRETLIQQLLLEIRTHLKNI